MTSSDVEEFSNQPTTKANTMSGMYGVGRFFLRLFGIIMYRPKVQGRRNIPRTGPVILASNHLSFIDSFAIPVASPRPVHFLAKSSYFDGTGFSGWLSRTFLTSVGAIAVKRGGGQSGLDALDLQRQLLEQGRAVALYPEGTRSLDGRLYKGRTGTAFLALQTNALVVPVALIGTDKVLPVGKKFPSFRNRVTIKFGEPIDVSQFGDAKSGRARRLVTDRIMAEIHAMSGQELAGVYNEPPAQNPLEKVKRALPHERR